VIEDTGTLKINGDEVKSNPDSEKSKMSTNTETGKG
jgi:hypothetical protein